MAIEPLFDAHAEETLALEDLAWLRLKRIFRRAKAEMVRRLEGLLETDQGLTVRAQHAAATIFEVSQVLGTATPEFLKSLGRSTSAAIDLGLTQSLAELGDLELRFGEPAQAAAVMKLDPILPVDVIARISDPQQALLSKFGEGISQAAADSLGVSLAMGEGIRPAAKRLGETIDGEGWKLERIARTEINGAMNASHLATMVQVVEDMPELDIWKQWSAETGDGRCCQCCSDLDGQVQKLDADFIAPDGWTGPGPTKHPNCRCRVNPWSPRWTEGKAPKYVTASAAGGRMATTASIFSLKAMALDVPETSGAPNRHPFSGVLCQLDVPSTRPPEGSGGNRVILPTDVAERILPTLLGQGVNFRGDLAGHDVQRKVGIITAATIEGGEIHVEGIIYDADFPEVVPAIKAANAAGEEVGMSFELGAGLVPERAGVSRIKNSNGFTGAAILLCKDAAYQQTRLAASAAEGAITMTNEELAALLAANNKTLLGDVKALIASAVRAASTKKGKAALDEDLGHANDLHAAAVKSMSGYDNKEATAHMGALGEHLAHMKGAADDYQEGASMSAAAAPVAVSASADPAITAAIAEMKATLSAQAALSAAQAAEVASLTTRLAANAQEPERKTISPAITALLASGGMTPKADETVTAADINAACDKLGYEKSDLRRVEALMKLPS
jgi:hypothetical protein